jgi:hypothetical protein
VPSTWPLGRNHFNRFVAYHDRGGPAERHIDRRTPLVHKVATHWKADLLAEEAEAIGQEALDLLPQM